MEGAISDPSIRAVGVLNSLVVCIVGLLVLSSAGAYGMSAFAPTEEDPGADGDFAVVRTDYDLGDIFTPTGFTDAVEVRARVFFPSDLTRGPYPLIIFLHGYFSITCYNGTQTSSEWPCPPGFTPIPSAPVPVPSAPAPLPTNYASPLPTGTVARP